MKTYLTSFSAAMTVMVPFLLGASTVYAQSTKPGLWEITNKMGGNAQMDSAMAQAQK